MTIWGWCSSPWFSFLIWWQIMCWKISWLCTITPTNKSAGRTLTVRSEPLKVDSFSSLNPCQWFHPDLFHATTPKRFHQAPRIHWEDVWMSLRFSKRTNEMKNAQIKSMTDIILTQFAFKFKRRRSVLSLVDLCRELQRDPLARRSEICCDQLFNHFVWISYAISSRRL